MRLGDWNAAGKGRVMIGKSTRSSLWSAARKREEEMTESQYASLDAMLFGLQLMSFEILWDAFPWMQSIWIREEGHRLQLFVQTAESQDEKEWDDLNYLLREMFDVEEKGLDEEEPGSKHKIEYSIEHGPLFQKIADIES